MWARLIPILLVAALAVSCHKADRQTLTVSPTSSQAAAAPTSAPAANTPAAAVPGQPPRPGTITLAPQTAPQTTPAQLSTAPAATLLANPAGGRILPDDFKIGALGDIGGTRKDQQGAMTAAVSFLSALTTGTVDGKLLTADARGTVGDTLSWGLGHGQKPTSFRLGEPRTRDDGEVTASVRLFGDPGTAEGEIYMTRTGDQWLVSDVQVSLASIAVKRPTPKEKFFPSSYHWLLED